MFCTSKVIIYLIWLSFLKSTIWHSTCIEILLFIFFQFDDGNSFLHGGGDWTNVIIPGDSQRTRYYYIIKIVITCYIKNCLRYYKSISRLFFISVRFSSTIEKTTWLKISDQMPNMNVLCKLGINLAGVMQAEYSISSVENPVRIQIEFFIF